MALQVIVNFLNGKMAEAKDEYFAQRKSLSLPVYIRGKRGEIEGFFSKYPSLAFNGEGATVHFGTTPYHPMSKRAQYYTPLSAGNMIGDIIAVGEAIKEAVVEKFAQSHIVWELIVTHRSDELTNFKKTYSSEQKLVTPDMITAKLDWQP